MIVKIKVKCNRCGGDGWYIVEGENGEPEQEQCEACMAQGYFEEEFEIDDHYMQ